MAVAVAEPAAHALSPLQQLVVVGHEPVQALGGGGGEVAADVIQPGTELLAHHLQVVAQIGPGQGQLEPQLVAGGLEAVHGLGDQGQLSDSGDGIGHQQGQAGAAGGVLEPVGHPGEEPGHRRVDEEDGHIGHDAPEEAHLQTDPALDVEAKPGVVPVAHMGGGLQEPRHEVLPRGHYYHGGEIEHQQVVLQWGEKEDHQQNASAIDGADGSVEKAPGDIVPLLDGAVAGLPEPAAEGIKDKIEEQQRDGLSHEGGHVHSALLLSVKIGEQHIQHAVVDLLRMGLELLGEAVALLLGGGQHLDGEQVPVLVVQGHHQGEGAVPPGDALGADLSVPAQAAVELGHVLVALDPDGVGEAALADGAVFPALVGDGVAVLLQHQVLGIHQFVDGLGEGEVVHAFVTHGEVGQGGHVDGGHHTGHDVEHQKFDVQLVMDEANASHGVPPCLRSGAPGRCRSF